MTHFKIALLLIVLPLSLHASDAWVILGHAGAGGGCFFPGPIVTWTAEAVAQNTGSAPATVQIVHDSLGGNGSTPYDVVLDPQRSIAMVVADPSKPTLVIRHLDVPDGVLVDGRLEFDYSNPCVALPPAPGPAGKMTLPVFHRLTPANETKVIMGTDIGYSDNARINVGIYNAAFIPATATIEARRGQCEGVKEEVIIPGDTLVQFTLKMPEKCDSTLDPLGLAWAGFTSVKVDQPSLSYAVVLSNVALPNATFTAAASN